ncbi:unnamed protein product [Dicrocoelium dendriticum]|nr:unnamed protein product [Dicrocoelium dendriticum]
MPQLLAFGSKSIPKFVRSQLLSLKGSYVSQVFASFSVEAGLLNQKVKCSKPSKPKSPLVDVWEGMTVGELAAAARREPKLVLSTLNYDILESGKALLNTKLEDKALLMSLVKLMGLRPRFEDQSLRIPVVRDAHPRPPAQPSECVPRPAVVAVLGHVDHGKTTLLDSLRATRMVDQEYGGITQHLAAFTVSLSAVAAQAGVKDPMSSLPKALTDYITFLDTPGHAAFSAIRARGASATDIIILVVAADDSVMPQTVESIHFAKEANAPIIVAINKMDKREADAARVMADLAALDVVVEQLGGDVQSVEISALRRINLHSLLEAVCLQAEMMQLCADPSGPVEGFVLEAKVEHGIGKVATCLVTRGHLQKTPTSGPLVAGEATCSPRLLFDDRGQQVTSVCPGFVAKVAGWKELPTPGDTLLELDSLSRAAEVVRVRRAMRINRKTEEDYAAYAARMAPYQAEYNAFIQHRQQFHRSQWRKLDRSRPDLTHLVCPPNPKLVKLPLLIKADVQGSLEAIKTLLSTCPSDACDIEVGLSSIGPLTESEVMNAKALDATILLFNVPVLPEAEKLAETEGVQIKQHNIIYRLAEDVRDMICHRLPPLTVERIIGEAEILALFVVKESRGGGAPLSIPVAGCRCIRGQLLSNPKSASVHDVAGDVVSIHYRVVRPYKAATKTTISSRPHSAAPNDPSTLDNAPLGTVVINQAACRSMRHQKTFVDCTRRGVECGLSLTTSEPFPDYKDSDKRPKVSSSQPSSENFVSTWEVGDRIQCCAIIREPQKIQWEF